MRCSLPHSSGNLCLCSSHCTSWAVPDNPGSQWIHKFRHTAGNQIPFSFRAFSIPLYSLFFKNSLRCVISHKRKVLLPGGIFHFSKASLKIISFNADNRSSGRGLCLTNQCACYIFGSGLSSNYDLHLFHSVSVYYKMLIKQQGVLERLSLLFHRCIIAHMSLLLLIETALHVFSLKPKT